MQHTPNSRSDKPEMPSLEIAAVHRIAVTCGFSDAGVVALPHSQEALDAARFNEWVKAGRSASMHYLERQADDGALLRARVQTPFPWARSIIVCFASYQADKRRSLDPAPDGSAWIARYAWSSQTGPAGQRRPSDYHKVLLKRLHVVDEELRAKYGDFTTRAYVDTGPLMERSLAVAAGLGWAGKNTCLIHPRLGSFGFLAALVTSLPVQAGAASLPAPDRCGTCRRCIDACPTSALTAPYQLDARLCISYLTIEHRGPIDAERMEQMGRQIFGCDICQEVCPWNRKAPLFADPDLEPRNELVNPALEWLAAMDEASFEATYNGSPVRRARFAGLRRNVAIAIGNGRMHSLAQRLRCWAEDADDGVRTAAQWALHKLGVQ